MTKYKASEVRFKLVRACIKCVRLCQRYKHTDIQLEKERNRERKKERQKG